MAHKIQAINAYRPRIEQGNTVQKAELIRGLRMPQVSWKAP